MCGIVGIFGQGQSIEAQLQFVQTACASMEKRGPDATGIWTDHQIYSTGFVRLAIRDLSAAANQPMVSPCKNYTLSYNGELYNCAKIKQQLSRFQTEFATSSDTEILLASLIHLGVPATLALADGMFAFAFYEVKQQRLTLARDKCGIKPLYIGELKEGLIYASEYKHIVQHPEIKQHRISEAAIGTYLQLGFIPDGMGFLENTMLFPHGHYLEICPQEKRLHGYWEFPATHKSIPSKPIHEMAQTLDQSVADQLISDVAIGTFLSGGVDAPLVTQAAVKANRSITAYTIGTEDPQTNEALEAADFASIFGVSHKTRLFTPDLLKSLLAQNEDAFSEPFADYSSLPTLLLASFAQEEVKVALSGDGADELFWGYSRGVRLAKHYDSWPKSNWRKWNRWATEKLLCKPRTITKRELGYSNFTAYAYSTLFISGALKWIPRIFKGTPEKPLFYQKCTDQAVQNWPDKSMAMGLYRKLEFDFHLQRILLKVDRASMYNSLEVRVPFLSDAMVAYASSLSYEDCIVEGSGKYHLKKHLQQLTGSNQPFNPKKGFTIPLAQWIRTDLKEVIAKTILPMPPALSSFFNQKEVQKMFDRHVSGKEDTAWLIWSLYTLVRWHQKYCSETIA